MTKKRLHKATFEELIRYYKKIKLGIQKACLFLKDLEIELEKLSQLEPTEHCYYNPDTEKKYYFSPKNVSKVRTKIDDLLLEYCIMKPELLKLEECEGLLKLVVIGIQWYDLTKFRMLDFLLSFRSDSEQKKLDILARLFSITLEINVFPQNYNEFLTIYGEKILDFCVFRFWDQRSEKDNLAILDFFYCQTKEQLYEKKNLGAHLAKPIVDHLLTVSSKNFYFKDNKLHCRYIAHLDFSRKPKIPRVFSIEKGNYYTIDIEKFYFFLEDLDEYRIRLDVKKLNKILCVKNVEKFEQMCLRFKSPETYYRFKAYFCNFLSKKLKKLDELDMKCDRFAIYEWQISTLIVHTHLARLNLHAELFNNYILSCFSSFEGDDEIFCELPHKYVRKKPGKTKERKVHTAVMSRMFKDDHGKSLSSVLKKKK